jgi:hypothetical protein
MRLDSIGEVAPVQPDIDWFNAPAFVSDGGFDPLTMILGEGWDEAPRKPVEEFSYDWW